MMLRSLALTAALGLSLALAFSLPSGPARAAEEAEAAAYVCPMHPEVRSDAPGSCPKCGMALRAQAPEAPAAPQEKSTQAAAAGAEAAPGTAPQEKKRAAAYACPMHPEVRSDAPGSCPKCGMALRAQAQEAPSPPPAAAPPATPAPATPSPAPEAPRSPLRGAPKPAAAKAAPAPAKAPAPAEDWTCSMHPELTQPGPGRCPSCGMFLVPRASLAAAPADPLAGRADVGPSGPAATEYGHDAHAGHGHEGHDHGAAGAPTGAAGEALYTCSMHPQVLQDGPGACPICGMDLVPAKTAAPTPPRARTGELRIDPVVVQNMGVRTAVVRRGALSRTVRTVGQLKVAEDRLSVVNLRYSGWVERIHVDQTGVKVDEGAPLFDIYSPELVSVQDEYLLALRSGGPSARLTRSARRRLELLGLASWQIRQLERRGEPSTRLTVTAPRAGYVVHKALLQGARVSAGQDLYRIADLSSVWVEAEVYEFDAPWIALGAAATVELTFQPGAPLRGQVSYVYPTLNPKSRTLRVRVELSNPTLALKPGMFATVEIAAQTKEGVLMIPTEAILHSGTRQLVFVTRALGRYEPREIRAGLAGARHESEVLEGLHEGERVVTSGHFLLDSESQLQEAVQKMLEARLEYRRPHPEGPEGATGESPDAAGSYWTCSMHPTVVEDGPGTCPICGMDLVEKER